MVCAVFFLIALFVPCVTGASPLRAALLDDYHAESGLVALSLLQSGQRVGSAPSHWSLVREDAHCSPLHNRGTHFTVEIEVGTPGQKFDVVADTGSDNVIVASCICNDNGHCRAKDKCFRGTNHSSTFGMAGKLPSGETLAMVLTFGSGQIKAVLATDVVRVGQVEANMDGSVLLMVDQALAISGPFEGILGLGLPRTPVQDEAPPPATPLPPAQRQRPSLRSAANPRGFLEQAGIRRFSMCFNDQTDGVLRLGIPEQQDALGSIGQFHWGVDFRGISVGNEQNPAAFCDPSSMQQGQDTPCGAIPDSGTTVMMGDAQHLKSLFEQLCDGWPRCQQQMAAGSEYQKYELFQVLLLSCQDWMDSTTGLNELPPLFFHLVGAKGNKKTLQLNATSYVFATREDEVHYVTKHLFGVFPVRVAVPTGRQRNVCLPAFASHQYNTVKNGPVWILGTPIFYQFQVGYDLKDTPPSITFVDEPCGSCSGPALLSHDASGAQHLQRRHGRPREVHGPLRMPSYSDVGKPF